MITINQNIISENLIKFDKDIDCIIAKAKQSVIDFLNNPDKKGAKGKSRIPITLSQEESNYLNILIADFEIIVKACPKKLNQFKKDFDNIIKGADLSKNHKEFKNELLVRMGYSALRNDFYARFFEKTGIKACVYCNSQLAVSVRTINGTRSAKFQIDHFLPKSEYPCFSISFYNLLPVCGPCNGKKNVKDLNFKVYSDNPFDLRNSPFVFELDKKSIISYRVNGTQDKLKVIFHDKSTIGFNETFDIEGIYSSQKDLAEELVLKSIIYNENYLKSLKNSFKMLYPNKIPMAERLLVGNYTREKDIHRRPMSKFTQDIARQLKLIK
jgi:hypothetical protein